MKRLKLLSLALALPLLALINVKPASAACAIAITINGIDYIACNYTPDDSPQSLSAANISGLTYVKDSHTIVLNGFNGTITGECRGTCTDGITDTLPTIEIASDSIINNIAFKAGTTATVPTASTTETAETTEATEATEATSAVEKTEVQKAIATNINDSKTDCNKPASILDQIASMPLLFIIWSLIVIILTTAVILIIQKLKNRKSQTPPSTPETPDISSAQQQ